MAGVGLGVGLAGPGKFLDVVCPGCCFCAIGAACFDLRDFVGIVFGVLGDVRDLGALGCLLVLFASFCPRGAFSGHY